MLRNMQLNQSSIQNRQGTWVHEFLRFLNKHIKNDWICHKYMWSQICRGYFFGGAFLFFGAKIGQLETFKWPSNAEEQTTAITAEGTED